MFRPSGDTESGKREKEEERGRKEENAWRKERGGHTHLPHSFTTMQIFADHTQSDSCNTKVTVLLLAQVDTSEMYKHFLSLVPCLLVGGEPTKSLGTRLTFYLLQCTVLF